MSERDHLRERLRPFVESAADFSGWAFDYEPRRLGPAKPWSYSARARKLLDAATNVVDLGTGGGERFAAMLRGYTGRSIAVEEWVVNVPVAAALLRPLGAEVVRAQSKVLPFRDDSFDLVLSRHEAIDPFELARVLRPEGVVLTQQVDGLFWAELRDFLPRWQSFGDHYQYYAAGFIAAGLTLVSHQRHPERVAYKFEEAVKRLCLMPWYIPDFDPLGQDLEALQQVERLCNLDGEITLTEAHYILEARA